MKKTEYSWGSGGCGRPPTNKDMPLSEKDTKYLLPRRF